MFAVEFSSKLYLHQSYYKKEILEFYLNSFLEVLRNVSISLKKVKKIFSHKTISPFLK